jgi:hypothetical protein
VLFFKDRLQWKDDFVVLADDKSILTNLPCLWTDLHALRLFFSQQELLVYFAPVYGCLVRTLQEMILVYPQFPKLSRLESSFGPCDANDMDLPNVELSVGSSCRDEDVHVNHVLVHCECLVGLSQ